MMRQACGAVAMALLGGDLSDAEKERGVVRTLLHPSPEDE